MKILQPNTEHTIKRLKKPSPRALNIGIKAVIVVIILFAGYSISAWIKSSAPTASMQPPEIIAPYVEIQTLTSATQRINIEVFGTVTPKTRIELKSRVAGEIIAVNDEFIEGGVIPQNTEIVRIDPKDYQLAVQSKKAEVATARYNLKLEEGQQIVAQNEWELLKDSEAFQRVQNTDLALRKPHLEKAKADLAAAQAELAQAELNLSRTKLTLPFNALVLSKSADLGSHVSAQETVAAMVDTEAYYVQASVGVDRLPWLIFPAKPGDAGSKATVYSSGGRTLTGHLVKVMGDLEENGRMARVLIEIKDPLGLENPAPSGKAPLLLGEYVRVALEGSEVANVISIDRNLLHDNDTVWLLKDGRLEIVPVDVIWRGRNEIFIGNTELHGREIVITNLPAPISGMQLRLETMTPNAK